MKRDPNEIDEGTGYIGYREAFDIVTANVRPLGDEDLPLHLCVGRVVSADLAAKVSYPSVDVSLKDGFAVILGCRSCRKAQTCVPEHRRVLIRR